MVTTRCHQVDAVLSYYERIDSGDVDAALSCFDRRAVYYRPGYGPLKGIRTISSYYRDVRVIGTGRHVIHDAVSDGAVVAVRGSFTGLSRTGDRLSVEFSDFWEFDHERVVVRRTFFDAPAV